MLSRSMSFAVAGVSGAAVLTAASAPSPLYPVWQQLWGFSAFTLTAVFAVYVFALLAALLTVGSISDRVGRRPVTSAALLLLALGMLLFATAGGVGDLLVARIVQGVAVGSAAGATTAMIMDHAPSHRTGSSVSSSAPLVGLALGLVAAGALVEYAPDPRRLVFWVLGAAYVVLAVAVWWVPERSRPAASAQPSWWRTLAPSAGLPSGVRPVFVALVPVIAATWALAGLYLSLGSSILGSILGVASHFAVGLALAVLFFAGVLGVLAGPRLSPRVRDLSGALGLIVGVLATLGATGIGSVTLYVLGSLVAGLGFGAAFSAVVGALGAAAPAEQRGEVFATMYIVSYLAFSVPALLAGLADQVWGLEPTVVAYSVVVVVLVGLSVVARARQTPAAAHPAPVAGQVPSAPTAPGA